MAKTTPSFITEIPLATSSKEQAILRKRFWAAKQQYNALLGEALKRLKKMRADPQYKEALDLYRKGEKKQAKDLFKALREKHGYREYDLHSYSKQWNKKKYFLSIGSHISQKLATRTFQAVEQYKRGRRGKPRFKGHRGITTIEDKDINANLRLKENIIHYLGLQLPLQYNPEDLIHTHGLNARTKYIRLIKRNFNGRIRYFAQLINEGTPWIKSKNKTNKGTLGLDIGPQTIAIVSKDKKYASLRLFADELKLHKKKKIQLSRKISRRIRLNNPEAYEATKWIKKDKHWHKKQGKSIKGKRAANRSKTLQKTFNQLADIHRRQAAHRKTQHGKLINEILQQGNHIKTEKLSYKAFQKLYGSSIGLRAPGMFIEKLHRKAANAGGQVENINTYRTKLSQACHCGKHEKKPLQQRWHKCPCGTQAQRDLYSAYLACFVEKDKLMVDQARKAWSGMDIALHAAMNKIKRSSSGPLPASLGLSGSESVACNVS